MMRIALSVLAWLVVLPAGAQPVRVERGVDVPAAWRPDRHLYVKGDLGVPEDRLDELSSWLAEHAPNWTILLARDARDETFRDAAGETFRGMDAVEHALGKTLPSSTAFGELRHPQTGEKNGAYFILFLDERKLSYHASEAYDRRQLGEDHWIGNLDAAAIAAMRQGGRVVDAARDTVTSIDRELARRIERESQARAREAERLRRVREETAAVIAATGPRLDELEARAAELRREYPRAVGGIARPPVGQYRAGLESAARTLEADQEQAAREVDSIVQAVDGHFRAIFAHADAPAAMAELREELDEIRVHEFSAAAREELQAAKDALNRAEEAHVLAEPAYADHFATAGARLEAVRRADRRTREELARLERLEREAAAVSGAPDLTELRRRIESGERIGNDLAQMESSLRRARMEVAGAVRRRQAAQAAALAGGGVLALALIVAAIRGNRRRRAPMQRALELFHERERELREQSDGLLDLFDRAKAAVGSAETLERSGWEGATRRLAGEALDDVDHLFILASGFDRAMARARALVLPESLPCRVRNWISSRNYERGMALLEREPLNFAPGDPLRLSLPGGAREMSGKGPEKPFSLTFPQLHEVFRERRERADHALSRLETCWQDVQREVAAIADRLEAIAGREGPETPAVYSALLPAVQRDHEEAVRLAAADPIAALDGPLPRAVRRLEDASAILDFRDELHGPLQTKLRGISSALAEQGRAVAWMRNRFDELARQLDALATAAVDEPAGERLGELEAVADELGKSAGCAKALDERAREVARPAIADLHVKLDKERDRIAAALGLPAERVFAEPPPENPTEWIRQAEAQLAATFADLDEGDPENAAAALAAGERHVAAGHGVIGLTIATFAEAEDEAARLARKHVQVAARLPEAREALAAMQAGWNLSALKFRESDETVVGAFGRANARVEDSGAGLEEAAEFYRAGRILAGRASRIDAERQLDEATAALGAIHAHQQLVETTFEENQRRIDDLGREHAGLAQAATAHHAGRGTIETVEELAAALGHAREEAGARGISADPFLVSLRLDELAQRLATVPPMLERDRAQYDEVARSLSAADREMAMARTHSRQSVDDRIPDSAEIVRCNEELAELEARLAEARCGFEMPHSDWSALDAAADAVTADAARLAARLRGELKVAEAAVRMMERAAGNVRQATGWIDLFGIGRTRNGGDDLDMARAALAAGNYTHAGELAALANRKAEHAIQQAAAERRRRSVSFGGGGGRSSFGGGSSRSSFRSGSGASRSSFSSGSGTSRSGW